jgi:hypothetical protein
MRHYQYLLISILFLFFQSCVEKDNFQEYNLETLGVSIKLPRTYRPVNKERVDRILNHKEDQGFKNELLSLIQRKKNVKMLIDTINPYKFILITEKVPYVKIDTISMYIQIDDERKKSSSRADVNDSTYFVGSRLDSIGSFRFIECKHTRKSGNRRRIGYTFMISDDAHTSGISFFSPEEQDARKFVKTILKK